MNFSGQAGQLSAGFGTEFFAAGLNRSTAELSCVIGLNDDQEDRNLCRDGRSADNGAASWLRAFLHCL
jgi:hypothetical protein